MPVLTRGHRKRPPKEPPRAAHRAGSPEAIELVRRYVRQMERLAKRGIVEREAPEPRKRPL